MARKQKDTTGSTPAAQARRALLSLGVDAVKTIVEKFWPDAGVQRVGNSKLVMRCPLPAHPERSPSFNWHFDDGHVHCYGCGYHSHNLFDILRDTRGMSVKDVSDLIREYGVRIISDAAGKEIDDLAAHTEGTRVLMRAFNLFLQRCLTPPPDNSDYSPALARAVQPTLDWLYGARQHVAEQAPYMPYGIVPPENLLDKLVAEVLDLDFKEAIANRHAYPDAGWRKQVVAKAKLIMSKTDVSWAYTVSFHYGYGPNQPGRIKLRRPINEKGSENIRVLDGWGPKPAMGLFGLYSTAHRAFTQDAATRQSVFVVEGENDCLTFLERYRESGLTGVVYVAGGGGAVDLEMLKDAGFDRAHVVSDDPKTGNGDGFVHTAIDSARRVQPFVFVGWPQIKRDHPLIKDPDDAVLALGFRAFYDIVCDPATRSRNYRHQVDWAIEQVDARRGTKTNVQELNGLAREYGKLIHDPVSQAAFIEQAANNLGLPQGALRNSITQDGETAASFRLSLVQKLKDMFIPLYYTDAHGTIVMQVWNKADHTAVSWVTTNGESIAKSICVSVGDFYEWVCAHIGIPVFMSGGDVEGNDASARGVEPEVYYAKKLYDYAKLAVEDMLMKLPRKSECVFYKQGIHRLPDPDPRGGAEYAYYIVNGRTVYKGTLPRDGADTVNWVELAAPVDSRYLFQLDSESWSKEITNVNDLNQGNHSTLDQLRSALNLVQRAFSKWRLRSPELDAEFLAHHLFAMAVPPAFQRKVILALLGEQESGKSTLLSVFAGGKSSDLRLLEMSEYAEDYSTAAVYQGWGGTSLGICLDEFEDTGQNTPKAKAVEAIQTMFRSLFNEQGTSVRRGTNNPDEEGARCYMVDGFPIFASINKTRNAVDESRRIDVYTRHCKGLPPPEVAVFEDISREEYRAIRRLLSLGMFRNIELLRRHVDEIRSEINSRGFMAGRGYTVSTRFLDCLIPACAIMELVGHDWRKFVYATCDYRTKIGDFESRDHNTQSARLLDAIFSTPAIQITQNGRSFTKLTDYFLETDEQVDVLNNSSFGVYFMKSAGIVIVSWATIRMKGGILDKSYQNEQTAGNLKHVFDQNPNAIRPEDVEALGLKKFVQKYRDLWRGDKFSAIDVNDMIRDLRAAKTENDATSKPTSGSAAPEEITKRGSGNID